MKTGHPIPKSRIQPRVAGSRSRGRRHRSWIAKLAPIFAPTLLTFVVGGTYYLLNHSPLPPASRSSASADQTIAMPPAGSRAATGAQVLTSTPAKRTASATPKTEPVKLFAAGDASPFDNAELATELPTSRVDSPTGDSSASPPAPKLAPPPQPQPSTEPQTPPRIQKPKPAIRDHRTTLLGTYQGQAQSTSVQSVFAFTRHANESTLCD